MLMASTSSLSRKCRHRPTTLPSSNRLTPMSTTISRYQTTTDVGYGNVRLQMILEKRKKDFSNNADEICTNIAIRFGLMRLFINDYDYDWLD